MSTDLPTLQIRTATTEDAPRLAAVHLASWKAAYTTVFPDRVLEKLSVRDFEASWSANLGNPDRVNLVGILAGQIVGFAALGPCQDDAAGSLTTGELYGLYLHPAHWRRGHGTVLFTRALKQLDAFGYRYVVVWVLEGNLSGRHFYEQAGFELEPGRRKISDVLGTSAAELRYRRMVGSSLQP